MSKRFYVQISLFKVFLQSAVGFYTFQRFIVSTLHNIIIEKQCLIFTDEYRFIVIKILFLVGIKIGNNFFFFRENI